MSEDRVTAERLLAHCRSPEYLPGKIKKLAGELGVTQSGYRAFRRLVKELASAGLLVRLRHNRYAPPETVSQVVGVLRVHPRGFGFVLDEATHTEFFVPREGMGGAFHGDRVRLLLAAESHSREQGPEGRVAAVVTATARGFFGTVRRRQGRLLVELEEPALGRELCLDNAALPGVREGQVVEVRILDGRPRDGAPKAEIVALLDSDDWGLDFLRVVQRFELPGEFPPAVDREANGLSLDMEGEIERRTDLRSWGCVTIDPPEAHDFDDAVSLAALPGGGYRLGVHIADVSHFVRPGTELDREARERGVSVYLLDRVIHMLPQRLATELCTLFPEQDRLALSVLIELDEQGEVEDYQIAESVIRSHARFTYEQVQMSFEGKSAIADPVAHWAPQLRLMRELSRKRRAIRQRRGALDFELPEPWVKLDSQGRPIAAGQYPRLESHRLIEEFMLLANECVGQYIAKRQLPALYRVHPPPDRAKLQRLADRVTGFQIAKDVQLKPADIQRWLKQLESRREGRLLSKLLLQTMMRAQYTTHDNGHFGLACRRYLHFTAPIRRYPDLLTHRLLKAHLSGELEDGGQSSLRHQLEGMGRWLSRCERRAEEAERSYVRAKQLRYLEKRRGEIYTGLVSGVMRGGFFVELEDFVVEGCCFLRELGDHFEFDVRHQRLVGRRTRHIIRIGVKVQVQIVRVDWQAGEMDLRLQAGEFPVEKGLRIKPARLRPQRRKR